MKRVWSIAAVCITALFLLISPASARAAEISMEAEAGFGGIYSVDSWTPVRVRLQNAGSDLEGSLEVNVRTGHNDSIVYSVPVILPKGSEKEYTVYVKTDLYDGILNVKLMDAANKVILNQKITETTSVGRDKYLLGLVTEDQPSLGYWREKLSGSYLLSNYEPVSLDGSNFPDHKEILDAFSVLIINNIDTSSFRPEQINALNAWLEGGGVLIIGTGANGGRTLSGLTDRVIKAYTGELGQLEANDPLEATAEREILGSTPVQVMDLKVENGEAVLKGNDMVLVWRLRKGRGMVFVSGFDLGTEPIVSWTGNKLLWENLGRRFLSETIMNDLYYPQERLNSGTNLSDLLGNIEAMEMPSPALILFIFLFYLALVGPLNYLFLKRIDKREWSWVTIPALSLIFAVLIYGLGYNIKGGRLITNTISLVKLDQNSEHAELTSHVGVFIPRRGDYLVEVDRFSLLSLSSDSSGYSANPTSGSVNPPLAKIVQGNPSQIFFDNVNIWTMETFEMESRQVDFGRIESDLYYEMGKIKGTIKNLTSYPLEHLVIYTSRYFAEVGNIAAGESKSVELDLPLGSRSGYYDIAFEIMETVFPYSGLNTLNDSESRKYMNRRGLIEHMVGNTQYASSHSYPALAAAPDRQQREEEYQVEVNYFAFYEGEAESGILINGKGPDHQIAEGFIFGTMNLDVARDGYFSLPPGTLTGRFEESMSQHTDHNWGNVYTIYDPNGYAVFSIDLSSYIHLNELKLMIIAGTRYGSGIMQILDLSAADYINISGDSFTIDEDSLSRYVDEKNMIYVKYIPGSGDYAEITSPVVLLEGRYPDNAGN